MVQGKFYGLNNTNRMWIAQIFIIINLKISLGFLISQPFISNSVILEEKPLTFRAHKEGITSVAFSPDGKYILSGSRDNTIKLWDLSTGKEIRTFRGHTDGITAVAFSFDKRYILSGSWDYTIRLWEFESGKEVKKFVGHDGPVYAVTFSPDGKYILSGGSDCALKVWKIRS